jgi:hypothetical protein
VTTAAIVALALIAAFFFVAAVGLHRQLQDERRLSKYLAHEFTAASDKYLSVISVKQAQIELLSKTPNRATTH